MESLDDLKKYWQNQAQLNTTTLNKGNIIQAVQTGLRKERNTVRDYVFVTGFWQWLVYAALCHLTLRFWGDWQFMACCIAGILLYIPFTWVFMQKIKAFHALGVKKPGVSPPDLSTNINAQYAVLAGFYRFKKRFDLFMIPGAGFIITLTLAQFALLPPILPMQTGHVITFFITIIAFTWATYFENKKRFIKPLQNLQALTHDLEDNKNK